MTPEKMAEQDKKREEQMKITGKRIKKLITDQHISQARAADNINISTSVLSDLINGKRTISSENILKICDYFQVSSDYLLGLTDVRVRDLNIAEAVVAAAADITGLSAENVRFLKEMDRVGELHLARLVNTILEFEKEEFAKEEMRITRIWSGNYG